MQPTDDAEITEAARRIVAQDPDVSFDDMTRHLREMRAEYVAQFGPERAAVIFAGYMADTRNQAAGICFRRRSHDLANAPLLVWCPRCQSMPGLACQTATGFYGGISGPHAARKKLAAAMSEDEILTAWAKYRVERAVSRAATDAMFARQRFERDGDEMMRVCGITADDLAVAAQRVKALRDAADLDVKETIHA